jgi:hypothetical protein
MSEEEQAILYRVNADNWAKLYRCRWSVPDAELVVAQLAHLLESDDSQIIDEPSVPKAEGWFPQVTDWSGV